MADEGRPLSVLYLCVFGDERAEEHYRYGFAESGRRTKRSNVRAMRAAGMTVRILSPVMVARPGLRRVPAHTRTDPVTGVEVRYPSSVQSFWPLSALWLLVTTLWEMWRARRREPYDVVYFHNWLPHLAVPAVLGRWLFGAAAVLEYEDGLFVGAKHRLVRWSSWVAEVLGRPFLDGAVVISENFLSRIRTPNVALVRGHVAGEGEVRDDQGGPSREDPADEVRILFSGRLDRLRGVDLFLEACGGWRGPDRARFWITGYGTPDELKRVGAAVDALGRDDVRFFGRLERDEYLEVLARADVAVNLQDPEHPFSRFCFPSKLIEYWSSGKIVVTTRVADVAAVADGIALLVDHDPAAVRRRLEEISGSPGDYRELGRNARRWVRNNCLPEAVGQKLRGVFERAAD